VGLTTGGGLTLAAGFVVSRTDATENAGRFFATLRDTIYGADGFVQLGATARLVYDPQATSTAAPNRIRLSLQSSVYPGHWVDVERSFARASGVVSALLSPSMTSPLSLALRAGGERVWGRFPFSEAAFLGGSESLRGWDEQRFAGDAAAFASGEVRVRVGSPRVIVPVAAGIFGFADVGRVYLEGQSPGGWRTSVGGGIWLKPVAQPYILRWGAGVSDEATKIYVALGLPY
jgi:hypothetical protein